MEWEAIELAAFGLKHSGIEVVLWVNGRAVIGFWKDSDPSSGQWVTTDGDVVAPTHFALIEQPRP